MNKEQANREAKKVYEEWMKKRQAIEDKAKQEGTWNGLGLDTNNYLFKEVDKEAKEKLEKIKTSMD